jgi:arginine deiminase
MTRRWRLTEPSLFATFLDRAAKEGYECEDMAFQALTLACERIAELETENAKLRADCVDMAADVIADARAQYGDGTGAIDPRNLRRYRRNVETAAKYADAGPEFSEAE